MRYERSEDGRYTYIFLDDGETERQVLRSIVKASFALAHPSFFLPPSGKEEMTDEEADWSIALPPDIPPWLSPPGDKVVEMDDVFGRVCKTGICRRDIGDGEVLFALHNRTYSDRLDGNSPEQMLERAKQILKR